MNSDAQLKVELAPPELGGTIVTLEAGDNFYQFVPSYVPYDSFGELVHALLGILDGYDETIVRWNDEPLEHKFVFRQQNAQVVFNVYAVINSVVSGKVDEELFSFSSRVYEVLRPFWKALRDMQARQTIEEYEKQWRWRFPEREMLELTRKLKNLKNNSTD